MSLLRQNLLVQTVPTLVSRSPRSLLMEAWAILSTSATVLTVLPEPMVRLDRLERLALLARLGLRVRQARCPNWQRVSVLVSPPGC